MRALILVLCLAVPASAAPLDGMRGMAAEDPGRTIESAKGLHPGFDSGALRLPRIGPEEGREPLALPEAPAAAPTAAVAEVRAASAEPVEKESDAGWVVPSLAGAGLFVLGVMGSGFVAAAVTLGGLALLIYGLVKGVKKNGGTVNGAPVAGRA